VARAVEAVEVQAPDQPFGDVAPTHRHQYQSQTAAEQDRDKENVGIGEAARLNLVAANMGTIQDHQQQHRRAVQCRLVRQLERSLGGL
jgi:hypothetical protein